MLASLTYNREGLHPGLLDGIDMLQPEHLAGSPFQLEYAGIAPNPDDWPVLIEKVKRFDREFQGWPAKVRSLTMQVLLVCEDSDIVRPEHAFAPNTRWRCSGCSVAASRATMSGCPARSSPCCPGTTHGTLADRGEWLAPMVNEFLDRPDPTD